MPSYKNIPIRAITEDAFREAAELGLDLDGIATLLADSYNCGKSRRRKGIEERCVRKSGKILKIVIELKISKGGFEYWRIRQIGFVR